MNKEEFIQLLQEKKYKTAQNILSEMNDIDTAAFLEELDAKECALAFRLISKEKAADVFSCMNSKMQTFLVDMFSETELKELLDDLYMDDTVDMLEDLPANLVTRILKNLDSTKRSTINKLLKYPEDSAGSIMTTEYVTLKKTMTVKQAMNHIKEIGIHKETIYTCYVTENKRLMGIVTAKSLMTSDDNENITNCLKALKPYGNPGEQNLIDVANALLEGQTPLEQIRRLLTPGQQARFETFQMVIAALQAMN